MTPSEIADWLDDRAMTLGTSTIAYQQAAATIRELEARALQAEEDAEMWKQGFAGSQAKLKVATEGLEKIIGDIYDEEEASEETIAAIALARIKEV